MTTTPHAIDTDALLTSIQSMCSTTILSSSYPTPSTTSTATSTNNDNATKNTIYLDTPAVDSGTIIQKVLKLPAANRISTETYGISCRNTINNPIHHDSRHQQWRPPFPQNTLNPPNFNGTTYLRKMKASTPSLLSFLLFPSLVLAALYKSPQQISMVDTLLTMTH